MKKFLVITAVLFGFGALSLAISPVFTVSALNSTAVSERIAARIQSDAPFSSLAIAAPSIEKPDWYNDVTITYTVSQNGATSDLTEFAKLANETLNDPRGWSRLGVKFKEVSSGGAFRLILSQASLLPTYSASGCSADWSCNVGNSVIINTDRWNGASDSWNNAGGTLRDYRHMVVNHETGHWLGHDHTSCTAGGTSAPVMQQQSIDLMGCKFNPWPLESELWTTRI